MRTEHPKVVGGLVSYPLDRDYPRSSWVVGSEERDAHLLVPASSVAPVCTTLSYLDGSVSPRVLGEFLRKEKHIELNVPGLVAMLDRAGLLQTSGRTGTSSRIPTIDVAKIRVRGGPAAALLQFAVGVSAAFLIAAAVVDLSSDGGFADGVLYTLVLLASVVLHEAGHVAAARHWGLRPSEVGVGLMLGFIPMVYVRLPGLFRLPRIQRSLVYLAGPTTNALLALCLSRGGTAVGAVASDINLWLALLNVWPVAATDGYRALSAVFREPHLARTSWASLHALLRGGLQVSPGQVAYLAAVLFSLALLAATLQTRVLLWTWVPGPMAWLVAMVVAAAVYCSRRWLIRISCRWVPAILARTPIRR